MNEENIKKCWVINTYLMMGGFYPMWPRKVEPSLQIRKQKQNLIAYPKKKLLLFSFNTRYVGGQTQWSERGVTSFLSQYMATFHFLWHAY
jgi:hypothetical protein